MKIKMERVNSELARQITKIIAEDVKDPRLHNAIIGVTKLYTTPDLKIRKSVFVDIRKQRRGEARGVLHRLPLQDVYSQHAQRQRADQAFARTEFPH